MSNMKGWGLSARLIAKHFSALGDKVSEMIANFDPETATEADRDRLVSTLHETAQKLAAARSSFDKEHQDVVKLQELIATDEKAAQTLVQRLAEGKISEATVNLFCDELESNRARLPVEIQEEADAKEFMDELQKIMDALTKQLSEFDAAAKKAKQTLATANAQKDLQGLRLQRQEELQSLTSMRSNSSALSALTKRAEKVSNEAAGMRIMADLGQKPIDQAAEIEAIRASVKTDTPAGETALQRLQRLSGQNSGAA